MKTFITMYIHLYCVHWHCISFHLVRKITNNLKFLAYAFFQPPLTIMLVRVSVYGAKQSTPCKYSSFTRLQRSSKATGYGQNFELFVF